MKIERDFTTQRVTLHFESTGMRIALTDEETREFDKRMEQVKKDNE